MPLYDYQCKSCGFELVDVLQRINDPRLVYCPECNEPEFRQKLGAPNFILKGDGWYKPSATNEKSESE